MNSSSPALSEVSWYGVATFRTSVREAVAPLTGPLSSNTLIDRVFPVAALTSEGTNAKNGVAKSIRTINPVASFQVLFTCIISLPHDRRTYSAD